MTATPKPFKLTLTASEAAELLKPSGKGGHQSLHRRLIKQLAGGSLTVTCSDRQLGQLIRYITQYGSGGFQSRLRRAFRRSLHELIK